MDEKTLKNLKEAFAGESQANRKYLAFAKKAEEEGYLGAAKLFRGAAEAETIHALSHFKAMGAIGSTQENLRTGIEGETFEFEKMYPSMVDEAKSANEKAALISFIRAMEAEKVHAKLYKYLLENLNDYKESNNKFYLCEVCGNIEMEIPQKCAICGVGKEKFKEVL
jgi:rubrerythrin